MLQSTPAYGCLLWISACTDQSAFISILKHWDTGYVYFPLIIKVFSVLSLSSIKSIHSFIHLFNILFKTSQCIPVTTALYSSWAEQSYQGIIRIHQFPSIMWASLATKAALHHRRCFLSFWNVDLNIKRELKNSVFVSWTFILICS